MFSCRLDYSVRGNLRINIASERNANSHGDAPRTRDERVTPVSRAGNYLFPTENMRKNMNQNTKKTDKEILQSHEALLQEGSV